MLEVLQSWCREAVELYGDDWTKVQAFLMEKRAALRPHEQQALEDEFQKILRANSAQSH
jgi:hypothetical protein